MQPVLRIAELEADKAGQVLSAARNRLQVEEQKLVQLGDYQQDYRQRLLQAGQQGMTVDRLRLFDGFQQQLDKAMVQQQQMIVAHQQAVEAAHQAWQQLDIRRKSLEKMLERLKQEQARTQARSEQRNHDEFARRRPTGGDWR